MRKLVLAAALLASAGVARASALPVVGEVGAIVGAPDLDPKDVASIDARCKVTATLAHRLIDTIAARHGPATITVDFGTFDALNNLLTDVSYQTYFVSESNPAAPIRDAAQKCSEQLQAIQTDISLSRPLYDRLAAIPTGKLDPTTRYTLGKQLLAYRLAGVDRDAPTRAKIVALNKEITQTGLEFERNISEYKGDIVLDGPDALAGLPQDYIDAHKPGADGKIHLATTYPDMFPALRFADRESTRKAVYLGFTNRAYPTNVPVLERLIAERDELAHVLGYPDFATYVTQDKMIGSPQRAWAFLDSVNGAAMDASRADEALLLARYRQIDPTATRLNNWNFGYLRNLYRKEHYQVDAAEIRQYFTLDKARGGVFKLIHDLFGADIRPWQTTVWAPGVTAWQLYDGQRLVGRFYLDMSPRDGKFSHAAEFTIVTGVGGQRVPVAALMCNFPATGPMDHGDVLTFLHEFGHLIHSLYSGHQAYSLQSMDALQQDFIEAPSQLLEEWVWDYDTLKGFASDPSGKPIPADLVARMNAGRHFMEASDWQQQFGFSSMSLGFYSRKPGFDVDKAYHELYDRYSLTPDDKASHLYASFDHLNGYSAVYYTYAWSKAIALDLFTRFKTAGIRDPATALAYRRAVLDPGGSKPADALIHDFLGRDTNTDAFRAELAASSAKPAQ